MNNKELFLQSLNLKKKMLQEQIKRIDEEINRISTEDKKESKE